jgi:hypothetical protein
VTPGSTPRRVGSGPGELRGAGVSSYRDEDE